MQWELHISPLEQLDGALEQAQQQLARIGQELVEAAKTPLLPLPVERGMFDDAHGFKVRDESQ